MLIHHYSKQVMGNVQNTGHNPLGDVSQCLDIESPFWQNIHSLSPRHIGTNKLKCRYENQAY